MEGIGATKLYEGFAEDEIAEDEIAEDIVLCSYEMRWEN